MEGGETQRQPAGLDAAVLLQIGTTIAAVAVALATIAQDNGPAYRGFQLVPAAFLIVGLVSIVGSLYAMAAIWSGVGMQINEDILAGNATAYPHLVPNTYQALIVSTWGLWFLTGVYVVMLYATAF